MGYFGEDPVARDLFARKRFRLLMFAAKTIYPEMALPTDNQVTVDLGVDFGDACVPVAGYPIKICAPSGVLQTVAYEALNTLVLSRLP